ncbi:radical SAM protein [Candidatus Pacearchaeota archaeon]|nr:radical SAM protein [Candidatus Pacearchaeota archaeon]
MGTARLLITRRCNRECDYCCNEYSSIMSGLKVIDNLKPLLGVEEVCITGGEPMIFPDRVIEVATILRHFGTKRIYLYSADTQDRVKIMHKVLQFIDGLHYTLHKGSSRRDIRMFHELQQEIRFMEGKSFRLYVHESVDEEVTILPNIWSEIRVTGWTAEEDAALPSNETLYELS